MKPYTFFFASILIILIFSTRLSGQSIGWVAGNDFASNNYTSVGPSFTVSYGTNTIQLIGGTVDFDKYIRYDPYVSGSSSFTLTSRHKFASLSAATYGMWTGYTTVGPAISVNKVRMYCSTTNDQFAGWTTLALYNGGGAQTALSSPGGFTMAVGDIIEQEIIQDVNPITYQLRIKATSRNITQGTSSYTVTDVSCAYPSTIELNNSFKVCFGQIGGTNTLYSWNFQLSDKRDAKYLFVGDSKTNRLYTTSYTFAFPQLLAAYKDASFGVSGGPSNRASMAVATTEELKKYNSKICFLFIGCNDVRGDNTSIPSCIANIHTIKNALRKAGTKVYVIGPTPENGFDFTTMNNEIKNSFSDCYIDFFTPFLGTGTGINSSYSPDGVHFNDSGMKKAASILEPYCTE